MTGSNNRNCAVPLCESYGDVFDNNRNRYMTYHKIPSNQEVKQAWVQRIRREELTQRLKYVTDFYESANLSCFAADRLFLALSRSRSTQLSARFISGIRLKAEILLLTEQIKIANTKIRQLEQTVQEMEFCIENIEDKDICFYTGFPNCDVYKAVLTYLNPGPNGSVKLAVRQSFHLS